VNAGNGYKLTGATRESDGIVWMEVETPNGIRWLAQPYLRDVVYPGAGTDLVFTGPPFILKNNDGSLSLPFIQGFGDTQFARDNLAAWYCYTSGMHNGLDADIPNNTPLVWSGNIDAQVPKKQGIYGAGPNSIALQAGNFLILYGHTSSDKPPLVNAGDIVQPGTVIGYSGHPRDPNNPHLHLEIRPLQDANGSKLEWPGIVANPVGFFSPELQVAIMNMLAPGYPAGGNPLSLGFYAMSEYKSPLCPGH